jgi:hypothetical protein
MLTPKRGEAGRLASPAADQVRACNQPEDRQGSWPDDSPGGADASRKGDQVNTMTEPDKGPVRLEELLVSSLAQTDALAKLLIERG